MRMQETGRREVSPSLLGTWMTTGKSENFYSGTAARYEVRTSANKILYANTNNGNMREALTKLIGATRADRIVAAADTFRGQARLQRATGARASSTNQSEAQAFTARAARRAGYDAIVDRSNGTVFVVNPKALIFKGRDK